MFDKPRVVKVEEVDATRIGELVTVLLSCSKRIVEDITRKRCNGVHRSQQTMVRSHHRVASGMQDVL